MGYKTFFLDNIMPPADCPDKTTLCNLGGIEKTVRVIQAEDVFGVVIDDIYLSLASGQESFKRGDYCLIKQDGKIRLGINENLY